MGGELRKQVDYGLTGGTSVTNYTNNGLNAPKSIVVDGIGDVFTGNTGTIGVSGFTSTGATVSGSPFVVSGSSGTTALMSRALCVAQLAGEL